MACVLHRTVSMRTTDRQVCTFVQSMYDSYCLPLRRSAPGHQTDIMAAEHNEVEPSVCAVGSMPNGCHIHECHDWKVSVELHVCCSTYAMTC